MQVKLLKDIPDNAKGSIVDVDADRANYWYRTGIAEPVKKADKKAIATQFDNWKKQNTGHINPKNPQ